MGETVLQEADRITSQKREEDYGNAYQQATRFAQAVNACTDLNVRPEHYHIIMLCLKLVREGRRHKRDNLVDIPGYARVGEMFWEELEQKRIDRCKKREYLGIPMDDDYNRSWHAPDSDKRSLQRALARQEVVEAARAYVDIGMRANYVATTPEACQLVTAVRDLEKAENDE